jgi:hypothetical protein
MDEGDGGVQIVEVWFWREGEHIWIWIRWDKQKIENIGFL